MVVETVLVLVLLTPQSLKLLIPPELQLLLVSDGEGVEYAIFVVVGCDVSALRGSRLSSRLWGASLRSDTCFCW